MPAVCITDHGNMHGAYEMWSAAVNAGIKPIIGIEAYGDAGNRTSGPHPCELGHQLES